MQCFGCGNLMNASEQKVAQNFAGHKIHGGSPDCRRKAAENELLLKDPRELKKPKGILVLRRIIPSPTTVSQAQI